MTATIGSLFSGYGGLELAAAPFFDADVAWHSDIDPGACKILEHHWPEVPNLGDITAIDWAAVQPVDILAAGWPCQPFSLAGKRKGALDERALWPEVARAVRALRPRHVFLENVAAIASAGELARAVADLASLGYVGSWRRLQAADVGAPHKRARIFILATDAERLGEPGRGGLRDLGGPPTDGAGEGLQRQRDRDAADHRSAATADAERGGRDGWAGQLRPGRRAEPAHSRNEAAADTNGDGSQGVGRLQPVGRDLDGCSGADIAWGAYEPAIRRWERVLGRPAPAPTEAGARGTQRLSPPFVEWMMGLPAGHVTAVPGLSRNAQLKALGNGVVPQQAYGALRRMLTTAVAA